MMALLMLMAVILMMMMINENSNSHNSPFEGKVHDYRLLSNPGLLSYIIHLHVGSVINQSINQSINFIYPRIYSVALKC